MVRTFIPQPNLDEEQLVLARRMFVGGCLGLPWLWAVNAWYFRDKLRSTRLSDMEIQKCESQAIH
jgi:hypothetical protein